jgi:nitric oxide dioxygenase
MQLSESSMMIIRETAPPIAAAIDAISLRFYRRLFDAHPELSTDLFNRSHQASGEQAFALARSIVAFAGLVLDGDPHTYGAVLDRVAHKHASLGVVAPQYDVVYEHLFAAIAEELGDAVTPEIGAAWTELYWLMANELRVRERVIYESADVQPGQVWRDAVVTSRVLESADVVSLELGPTAVSLPAFMPGQYISVQVQLDDGANQIRQYSLSRGRRSGTWRLGIKRIRNLDSSPDGEVSNFIYDNVFEGHTLRVSIPCGELTLDTSDRPLVLVSAGIGCTPVLGMLEHLAEECSSRTVTVLHADRAPSAHAYRAELAGLVSRLPRGRLYTWYELLPGGLPGSAPGLMNLGTIEIEPTATAFVCGPMPFMQQLVPALISKGLSANDVHYEMFGPLIPLADAATVEEHLARASTRNRSAMNPKQALR